MKILPQPPGSLLVGGGGDVGGYEEYGTRTTLLNTMGGYALPELSLYPPSTPRHTHAPTDSMTTQANKDTLPSGAEILGLKPAQTTSSAD